MAIYPCQRHGLRYNGPQSTLYNAVVNGTTYDRWKLRLCFECADFLLDKVKDQLTVVDPDGSTEINGTSREQCYKCGSHELLDALFVTAYLRGKEPLNMYGHTCPTCGDWFRKTLLYHPR